MKFSFIIACILFSICCKGQICFIATDSKLPIPALNIYHESGTLVGFTDKTGIVHFLEGVDSKRLVPMRITTQHISYVDKSFDLKSLTGNQTYELTPREIVIDDVVLSTKAREVIVLKGYYRSLETFNHQPKYFSDGIIEFYILLGKGKTKYRLIDYRIFSDSIVTDDFKEKMGPFFQVPRVPELSGLKLADRLKSLVRHSDSTNRMRLLKNEQEVGYITKSVDGNSFQLYLDKVLPDSVFKEQLFRLEAHTLHEVSLENYSCASMTNATPFDLTSIYQNIVGTIKRKSGYGHVPYEGLNEFYVMEQHYISLDDYKSIHNKLNKSVYKTAEKSEYTSRFWEDLDNYQIPSINVALAKQLGHNLKLVN